MMSRRLGFVAADVVALLVLAVVGWSSFWFVFPANHVIAIAIAAIPTGIAVGVVGAHRRWSFAAVAFATIGAYFAIVGAVALRSTTIAGVIPTLDTFIGGAEAAVTSWKQVVTLETPIEGFESALAAPVILILVATVVAASLTFRVAQPAWAVLPLISLLVGGIALGTFRPVAAVLQGATLVVVAVAWLAARRFEARTEGGRGLVADNDDHARLAKRRLVLGTAILILATLVGANFSTTLFPVEQRQILRDEVVPPIELHDYPSPLQSFRSYIRDYEDSAFFTVSDLPEGARVRLATLDTYDGVVFRVTGNGSPTAGSFSRVGPQIASNAEGETVQLSITIGALDGVWLPSLGYLTGVEFEGDRSDAMTKSLYYNIETGTVVVTAGIARGDVYRVTTVVPRVPTEDELREAGVANIPVETYGAIPDSAGTVASEIVEDESTRAGQVFALADYLEGTGFFKHGLDDDVEARSGHGAERIEGLFGGDRMVGDDEQYAVAFVLLAHELGIPARVVMGFYPEDEQGGRFAASSDDVHVWAEVPFNGLGWVAIDPMPAEDKEPPVDPPDPDPEPSPRPVQPPPPPDEPEAVPPAVPTDDQAIDDRLGGGANIVKLAAFLVGGLGLFFVFALPVLVLLAAKQRRTRRRRLARNPADRFSGGWAELVDYAVDTGIDIPTGNTRRESARLIAPEFDGSGIEVLARHADEGVWSPDNPTVTAASAFWVEVDSVIAGMRARRSWWERVTARMSLRSVARVEKSATATTRQWLIRGERS